MKKNKKLDLILSTLLVLKCIAYDKFLTMSLAWFFQKLMELGVERLILPAVPDVLHTWTASFGFSKMMLSERLQFVKYTFLDFQGATMCQKLLCKRTLVEPQPNLSNGIPNSLFT